MNIGIVGSRTFTNYELLKQIVSEYTEVTHIVSGGAKGADSFGQRYADENGISTIIHVPDWDTHGKSAGYKRNVLIVKDSDMIIAFWDGESKGTVHSIKLARDSNKDCLIIKFNKNNQTEWKGYFVKGK